MESFKKSLTDKFTMESKQKSPGKKSKKGSKVSKSLSRELARSSSPASGKKRAQKSSSDLVVCLLNKDENIVDKVEGFGTGKRDQSCGDTSTRDKVVHEPMDIDTEKHVHIEKLDTSLEATWTKPDDDSVFFDKSLKSTTHIPVVTFPTTSTSSPVATSLESQCSTLLMSISQSGAPSLPFIKRPSSSSVVSTFRKSISSVSSCYSSDSLASEMESYKLGTNSSSNDIDTHRHHSIDTSCEEIDIGECSSTSTPIKFSLFDEHKDPPTTVIRKLPPKFSLIREAAAEDFDSLSLSSDYSPTTTTTSMKSFDGRNRIDDFSDESDSSRMKESSEFSDDPDFHSHAHFVPLNKQLQIVTSMDRLMDR